MALAKRNCLAKTKDIDRVFKEGKAVKGHFLLIKHINNGSSTSRFGFMIPIKMAGGAAARNRIKRILSEAIRLNLSKIEKGHDVAIVLKKKGDEEKLISELLKLLNV
jgi:ribonuclease P protein component